MPAAYSSGSTSSGSCKHCTYAVGGYVLKKTIGTGNFSKVKLAVDGNGAQWAVKVIEKRRILEEKMEDQFLREICILRMLKHENIVVLREIMQTRNHYYIVQEFITGGELFDKIVEAKRFSEPVARRYFKQIMNGMYYCHAHGIAHRDLKPENILLTSDDTVKISDFGLANRQDDYLLQTMCGTPNYVAPEVLQEKGYNGLSADIWSCGVILYVMVAGAQPFDDPHVNTLISKISSGEYTIPNYFSSSLNELIRGMLTVNPMDRMTVYQVLQHRWMHEA